MKYYNRRIHITASALGILLGLSGILNHGIFEILQGNVPTHSFFIEAIGKDHRYWLYGTEGAFTLIRNFLFTGLSASIVALAIVLWSATSLGSRRGAKIFLLLFIALTLVGGGLGYIALVVPTCAFATRIRKPLDRWRTILPQKIRKPLSSLWIPVLVLTLACWLMVMQLGIFGYFPGQDDPDALMNIVFTFLFSTVFLACLAFVGAIAGDLEKGIAWE